MEQYSGDYSKYMKGSSQGSQGGADYQKYMDYSKCTPGAQGGSQGGDYKRPFGCTSRSRRSRCGRAHSMWEQSVNANANETQQAMMGIFRLRQHESGTVVTGVATSLSKFDLLLEWWRWARWRMRNVTSAWWLMWAVGMSGELFSWVLRWWALWACDHLKPAKKRPRACCGKPFVQHFARKWQLHRRKHGLERAQHAIGRKLEQLGPFGQIDGHGRL